MKRKTFLILLTLLQFSLSVFAQNKFTISGTVKDNTGQTLPGAGILIGDYRLGTVADSAGNFQLKVGPGNYNVLVQMIGYLTSTANVVIENQSAAINIVLKENVNQLNEVVIRPDKRRSEWLEVFKNSFIGTSANARKCKIMNPNVVDFEYNTEKKILTAKADQLLIVENQALGYRIKYLLKYFQKDEETGLVFFFGFPAFEELKGTASQIKTYTANRELAYNGSTEHFFSALYKNTLRQEGFIVKNLIKMKNPNYVPDTTIDDNIRRLTKKVEEEKERHLADALALLKQKKRQTDSLEVISRREFHIQDLLQQKTENLKTVRFDGALYVVFTKEKESGRYSESGYSIARPDEYGSFQISVINHSKTELGFYADGRVFDPASIITEGHMAYERIADMVPRDYRVTEY